MSSDPIENVDGLRGPQYMSRLIRAKDAEIERLRDALGQIEQGRTVPFWAKMLARKARGEDR